MEPRTKIEPMTREKAHALIKRLLTESLENRIAMEESFHTDPGIQAALARLEGRAQASPQPNEQV